MDDYERKNAETWDLIARGRRTAATADLPPCQEEEWTIITAKGSRGKNNIPPQTSQHQQSHSSHPTASDQTRGTGVSIGAPSTAAGKKKKKKKKGKRFIPAQQPHPPQRHHRPPPQTAPSAPATSLTPVSSDAPSSIPKGPRAAKKQPARPPPKLIDEDDNAAELSWRNHEHPAAHILIPSVLLFYGAHGREHLHENIARQHDAFISCQDDGLNNHLNFGIWGTETAVKNATRALNQWIHKSEQDNKSKKTLDKMHSLTVAARNKESKEWKRSLKRQRYRQNPPCDTNFEHVASFPWPVDEYRPEDSLGTSYEALDPIRMEFSCYVTFVKEQSVFRVYGKSKEKADAALARLKGTLRQVAARGINVERLYLPYWPDGSALPTHVRLAPYEHTKLISSTHPQLEPGHIPRAEGTDLLDVSMEECNATSELELQNAALLAVSRLHYYRGCIQMRIRLGTFLATQYKKPKHDGMYKLENYEDMIQEDQFKGHVTQELGDRAVEASALAALHQADSLLLPADNTFEQLKDVQPEYSVTFTFSDPAGDIRLTMSWRRMTDIDESTRPSFEMCSKIWTRVDRDSQTPIPILDATFSDLHSGMAWAFEISATQPIEETRLSEAYRLFSDSVKLNSDVAVAPNNEKLFVIFRPPQGNIHLEHIQQREVYRYTMLSPTSGATDYVLELLRFQDCDVQSPKRTVPERQPAKVAAVRNQFSQSQAPSPQYAPQNQIFYEPRWSLQIHRSGWDVEFAQNATLKVGMMAGWCDRGRSWFPADEGDEHEREREGAGKKGDEHEESTSIEEKEVGRGFSQLIGKLERVKKVVCR